MMYKSNFFNEVEVLMERLTVTRLTGLDDKFKVKKGEYEEESQPLASEGKPFCTKYSTKDGTRYVCEFEDGDIRVYSSVTYDKKGKLKVGTLHNEIGPAVIKRANPNEVEFYLNGKKILQKEWEEKTNGKWTKSKVNMAKKALAGKSIASEEHKEKTKTIVKSDRIKKIPPRKLKK